MEVQMKLNELKVGDWVINQRGNYSLPTPRQIERLTATQIIIGNDKYRRSESDYAPSIGGERWTVNSIQVPVAGQVEELKIKIRRHNIAEKLKSFNWHSLKNNSIIEEIFSMANAATKESKL